MQPEHPLYDIVRTSLKETRNAPDIFLVGGPVRDLLLHRMPKDLDFLVDGELFPFIDVVTEKLKAKVKKNDKLLTVSLQTKWGTVDFARARKETYNYPGALPQVEPAGLREDLLRRDFTVNALAWPLLSSGWGNIFDIAGGLRDLDDRLICVLHDKSFEDDPTRMLRALRFKSRLGFAIEKHTSELMFRAWPLLRTVSPVRRFKEWKCICKEKDPAAVIAEIYKSGGWEYFFAGLPYSENELSTIGLIPEEVYSEKFRRWFFYLLLLLKKDPAKLNDIAAYWGLPKKDREALEQILAQYDDPGFANQTKRQISGILQKLPLEGIYFVYQELFSPQKAWAQFYTDVILERIPVSGHDLLEMGLEPNAELGNILKILESYYRAGRFDTKEEALGLVREILKEDN